MTNRIQLSVSMGIQRKPTTSERIIAMTDLLSSKNYRRSGTDVGEVEDGGGSKRIGEKSGFIISINSHHRWVRSDKYLYLCTLFPTSAKKSLQTGAETKLARTYNSRYSLVVTHPTTNLPI
jgi:hypothetical protein